VPDWLPSPLLYGVLPPPPSSGERATRVDLVLEGVAGGVISSPFSLAPGPELSPREAILRVRPGCGLGIFNIAG